MTWQGIRGLILSSHVHRNGKRNHCQFLFPWFTNKRSQTRTQNQLRPNAEEISRNMEQDQTPLQHIEIKTVQSIFILEFCVLKATLAKHLLKLAIMFIMPVVTCCNDLWPVVDMQKKGSCMLSQHKTIKSIPSLPPTLYSKEIKKVREWESLLFKRNTMFPTCNRLIRQST